MKTRLALAALGALTLTLSACVVAPVPPPRAYYGDPVMVAPPPPRTEYYGVPPVVGHIWLSGFWNWNGHAHVWVPGRWEAPRTGHYWVPHRWEHDGRHWRQHGGHWQPDGRRGGHDDRGDHRHHHREGR